MKRNKRKGFAIILVAALAGLIFLLGASLVVVTHLQTAAANYDQRVRLAREHARASLDMAIAELQDKLGKDTAVSYYADALRDNVDEDFKDAAATGVREPFWTAARNGGTTSWLVTREMDGGVASPIGEFLGDSIKLLGKGTLGDNPLLEVSVPRESIQVDEVDGFTNARTIGHYAYWVGDLGTKASYALYDKSDLVLHDKYKNDANKRNRLSQLRTSKPVLGVANSNDIAETPTNPQRIDMFVNDFQFRDRFGTSTELERYLLGLTEAEVQEGFHDFTPLSKGLLVNSASGGFRKDATFLSSTGDADFDAYAKFARSEPSTATTYTDDVFDMKASDANGPGVHPVLTQFNLKYAIYLDPVEGSPSDKLLRLAFSAGFELWNPFTSSLKAEAIRFEVKGLPHLKVFMSSNWTGDLNALSKLPKFKTASVVSGTSRWKPGQVATFTGPQSSNAVNSPYLLSESIAYINDSTSRVVIDDLVPEVTGNYNLGIPFSFELDGVPETAQITVEMYLNSTNKLLATYELPVSSKFRTDSDSVEPTPLGNLNSSFGFSWEISDSQLSSFENYNPLVDNLNGAALYGFDDLAHTAANISPSFAKASAALLLGPNPTETDTPRNPVYDLPMFQLPKQELTSVAQLSGTYGEYWSTSRIGDLGDARNSLFDSSYFSTVGKLGGEWNDITKPLPNSGYVPRFGAALADVQSVDSAEELFVHGMFNVHSTSIDSWAALLKGCPSSSSTHWSSVFGNGVYLFFNYPLGGEDSYRAPSTAPAVASFEAFRASLKKNVIALTEEEVEQLAGFIVSKIRTRIQGSGPFHSLEEFVNSGILQLAIDENYFVPKESGDKRLNASWVVEGAAAKFRQSSILNLIAPYLSVRSDTFLVRAYGDAVDPSNANKIWARAYCEAILQRVHKEHVVGTNDREFKVVAFRWLSPSEI